MWETRLPVDRDLAQRLEDHFCETYQQHWMLEEDWRTGEHDLRGFFASPEEAATQFGMLREAVPGLPAGLPGVSELPYQDWKEAYKLHFRPWSDRGLHFVPVWERETYALPPGEAIIYLDPGMAFGTGNHETTRLCLRRLLDLREQAGPPGAASRSVLDVGCGSGILAIAARKLGFGPVAAFDNDPDSVTIAGENAALCAVAGEIEFFWAGFEDVLPARPADIVLANILGAVLARHAPLFVASVRPGGTLILSGILAREQAELQDIYQREAQRQWAPAVAIDSRVEGEWCDVVLTRPG